MNTLLVAGNNISFIKLYQDKHLAMENYPITVSKDNYIHHFEVGEYVHHDEEHCKYKVFENGVYVASFEPDAQDFLHICQNPGNINEEVLHLLADKIEAHHPQGINDNIRRLKL